MGRWWTPLATFFAATNPDRTLALCIDPHIQLKRTFDYPFENTEEEFQAWVAEAIASWGDEEAVTDDPSSDPESARWLAKLFRFGATPGGMAALSRMWFETDVRDILSTIRVPTLVLSMTEVDWAGPEQAVYVAERIPGARIATIPGGDPFELEDPEPFVSAIESFLASARREEAEMDRLLATVLFTDIVGSTAQLASLGDRSWRELIERHHAIVRALLARYRGTEMDTAGDGFFATFDGPLERSVARLRSVRP